MNTLSYLNNGAAELYDFTNLYELRNACYNLSTDKIIRYANQADADEVISLLLVLDGNKRSEFINGIDTEALAEAAEDLHASELTHLLEELNERKRNQLLSKLSDQVLYRLGSVKPSAPSKKVV